MQPHEYDVAQLEQVEGIGPTTAEQLVDEFGALPDVSFAAVNSVVALARLDGWSPDSADTLADRMADADVLVLRSDEVDDVGAGKLPDRGDYWKVDLRCNGCGAWLGWGMEYQLMDSDDDRDAVCRDCRGDFEEAV